jgi:hypothetical protein
MGLRGDDDVALHVHVSSISLSHIFLKTLFDNFKKNWGKSHKHWPNIQTLSSNCFKIFQISYLVSVTDFFYSFGKFKISQNFVRNSQKGEKCFKGIICSNFSRFTLLDDDPRVSVVRSAVNHLNLRFRHMCNLLHEYLVVRTKSTESELFVQRW